MSPHPFDLYARKHGHYPRLKFVSGVQTVKVEFAPGYVSIKTFPHGTTIYLTANAVRQAARQAPTILKLIRQQDRNVDVPKRIHQYYLRELEHLEELRQQKRARRGPRRRHRA